MFKYTVQRLQTNAQVLLIGWDRKDGGGYDKPRGFPLHFKRR